MKINKFFFGLLVASCAAGSTGIAVAVASNPVVASNQGVASDRAVAFDAAPTVHGVDGEAPFAQDVAVVGAPVKRAFPVIDHGRSASDAASEQGLRDQLGAAAESDHGPIGLADFTLARSINVSRSDQRAWVVPSGDRACAVISAPDGGYAAGCHTLDEIAHGQGWLVLGPALQSKSRTTIVAVLVPGGEAAPRLRRADGTVTSLTVTGGVAARAIDSVAKGDTLEIGSNSVDLDAVVTTSAG